MLFSKSIPESVLSNPVASRFIAVLDALQEHKQNILAYSVRSFSPILCTDEKWLIKQLGDFGFSEVQSGMPIEVMQQMLLNADSIMRLRGSSLGVELLCSVASLGEVTVSSEGYMFTMDCIILDTLDNGYVTGDDSSPTLYLCDNNNLEPETEISIGISSPYFPDEGDTKESLAIKNYLYAAIKNYLGFRNNSSIEWNFSHAEDKFYHSLLNRKFI